MTKKALSRAGLEPAPLGNEDNPSELPFLLIVTLFTRFVMHNQSKTKMTTSGRVSAKTLESQNELFKDVCDIGRAIFFEPLSQEI